MEKEQYKKKQVASGISSPKIKNVAWSALLRNRLLNAIYPENGNNDMNKGQKSATPFKSQSNLSTLQCFPTL